MNTLIFEDVYKKYLKLTTKDKHLDDTIKPTFRKMTQEQQVNFLKSLGKQKLGYDEYKIDSCSKDYDNNSYGTYIVKVPIIEEPILDKDCNIIEQPLKFYYKTCIAAISGDNENQMIIDNICLFENDNIQLVETKYNELCNIIKSSSEQGLLEFIDNEISSKI